jgi:hypothetical protein
VNEGIPKGEREKESYVVWREEKEEENRKRKRAPTKTREGKRQKREREKRREGDLGCVYVLLIFRMFSFHERQIYNLVYISSYYSFRTPNVVLNGPKYSLEPRLSHLQSGVCYRLFELPKVEYTMKSGARQEMSSS